MSENNLYLLYSLSTDASKDKQIYKVLGKNFNAFMHFLIFVIAVIKVEINPRSSFE